MKFKTVYHSLTEKLFRRKKSGKKSEDSQKEFNQAFLDTDEPPIFGLPLGLVDPSLKIVNDHQALDYDREKAWDIFQREKNELR